MWLKTLFLRSEVAIHIMDAFGFNINRAAVRLAISSLLFLLVQMGLVDPIIANHYREEIVDVVSAVMVIIFAIEFVVVNVIKWYHRLRHDPEYVEKPSAFWTFVNKALSRYLLPSASKVNGFVFVQKPQESESTNVQ